MSNNDLFTNYIPSQPNQLILHNVNWYIPNDPALLTDDQQNIRISMYILGKKILIHLNSIYNLFQDLNFTVAP